MTKTPAFLVVCSSCKGAGEIPFGNVDVHCVGCNGYGKILQPVTVEQMKEWCACQSNSTVLSSNAGDSNVTDGQV